MKPISYQEFGEAFVLATVTPERVVDAVKRIAGEVVELGPLRAGPGGAASVVAKGRLGEPEADETGSDPLTYLVRIPVDVSLTVRVGTTGRFEATGEVPLRLTVRTAQPLAIVIDVAKVEPADISFDISARGVQAKLLQRAGDVSGEMRRHTADYVNEQIGRPEAARYTTVDLLPRIETVWSDL